MQYNADLSIQMEEFKMEGLAMDSIYIVIKTAIEQPDENKFWSYPLDEIPYLIEQIKDNDRENGCVFNLYDGRLYELEEVAYG